MKILDRYIFRQLMIAFLLIALGMTGIVWLSQSLKMIEWIVNKGVSVGLFIELTLLVLPNFIAVITPLAFFIVLLFTYNRLLADKELVVMKSAGLSPWQLARPAVCIGLILVGVGYLLTLWLIPSSVQKFKELQFKIRNDLAHVTLQEGTFNHLPNNMTAYVRTFHSSGEMEGIFIYDARQPEKRTVLVAKEGVFLTDKGETSIVMRQGRRQEYDKNKNIFSFITFDHYKMKLENDKKDSVRSVNEHEQSLWTLLFANQEDKSSKKYRDYKVEAFKRLTQPFYSLVYLVIGLMPFLLGFYNRRGHSLPICWAIIAVVLIQSLSLGFENLSSKSLWYLFLMMANIVVPISIGFYILKKGRFKCAFWKKSVWLIAFMIASSSVLASPQFIADQSHNKDLPAHFEADSFAYDEKKEMITASGHVVVVQDKTKMTADKIVYDRQKDVLTASGHVVMTRPDGVTVYAEELTLTDKLKEGAVQTLELRLADGSLFMADSISRSDKGNITKLSNVFFTPCDYCQGERALWNIRASSVEHNYAEQEFIYKNAFLQMEGIPVFYWPYLRYPDFQVKRKTGFLAPSLASSSEMGTGVELPFFWAISDSQDLFLSPTIPLSHVPLVQGKYRGLFMQSGLEVDFSGTQNDDGNNEGHIKAAYEYDFNDKTRFKGNYYRVSNDTYFRRYPINNVNDEEPWIQSDATLDYFGTQDYAYARIYSFQGLREEIPKGSIPVVPQLNYQYTTQPLYKGLYGLSQVNAAGVYRDNGTDSTRLSVLQDFEMPYVSPIGLVLKTQGSIRVDGYAIKTENDENKNASRLYPNLSVEMRYPLIQSNEKYSQVLEPIVMGVWTPNLAVKDAIPNEDSLDYAFDDVSLFSRNRYTGYDKVETGTRLNYGMQWTLFGQNNTTISALLGQSYRFRDDYSVSERVGFDDKFSSYVGRFNIKMKDIFLNYRFRFNNEDLAQEMSEVTLGAGRDPFHFSVSYLFLEASRENLDMNTMKDREEITFNVDSKLTRHWSTFGYYQYDLTNDGGPIKAGGGLQYENECLILTFSGEKEYTKDRDYKGDTSFFVRTVLKTIGEM